MKTLTSLFLLLCVSAFGQGTAIRALNGFGTNTTLIGTARVGDGNETTNAVFRANATLLSGQYTGNGLGLTNVLEKNIAVTTNNWSVTDIDFALGTSIERTLSGNLSISGVVGFVSSNLNWQTIALLPDGTDRVISVPNAFLVSGFTNATTVTLPATNVAIMRVECVIGRRTNASFEIYYP